MAEQSAITGTETKRQDPAVTKRQRFLRHAERRTERVLRDLERLARVAKKNAYTYTDAEAESICTAVQDATVAVTLAFFPTPVEEKPKPAFRLPS